MHRFVNVLENVEEQLLERRTVDPSRKLAILLSDVSNDQLRGFLADLKALPPPPVRPARKGERLRAASRAEASAPPAPFTPAWLAAFAETVDEIEEQEAQAEPVWESDEEDDE